MKEYIDKSAVKQKVQEKLLNACERLYEAERALCELAVPQSWKDEAKAAWEEHLLNKKYSFISKNIQK